MAISFLTELPYDIKELILSNTNSTNDLASFARTSKEWASLIIPYHIACRNLRLSERGTQRPLRLHLPLTYLAQRVDLCRNIRTIYINDFHPDPESYRYTNPESFMMKQDSSGEDHATELGISHALSSMDGLLKFSWNYPWEGYNITNTDAEKISVLNILCSSRTLRTLEIIDTNYYYYSLPSLKLHKNYLASLDCPLWHISDLTSLTLKGFTWRRWDENSNLTELLKRSPNLEELSISYEICSPSFILCHFPKLRKLVLWPGMLHTDAAIDNTVYVPRRLRDDSDILTFLLEHPTIQYLSWMNLYLRDIDILAPRISNLGFLPNLKRIESHEKFVAALIHRNTPPLLPLRTSSSTLSHRQRTLEIISKIRLQPKTMRLLEYISGSELKELHISSYKSLKLVERVGDLFPNIEVLEVWMGMIWHYVDDPDPTPKITLNDYMEVLAHFPSLKYLLGTVIWFIIHRSGPEMDTLLLKLTQGCPKLTYIQLNGPRDMDEYVNRPYVFLFREELEGKCKVRWEYRGFEEGPTPMNM